MRKLNKFFDVKMSADKSQADIFIYGEIVSGDKWEDSDVTIKEFSNELEALDDKVKTLNMYINSPGGSVFTTVAMMNQLERMKGKVTINAYVDGIAASAASFLIMVADNIYMYQNAMLMIHKPMIGLLFGANASELREKAEWLDKVESSTCIPAYKSKGTDKLTDEVLNNLLGEKDTWLDAYETQDYFNVTILSESKDAVACVEEKFLYGDIPQQFKQTSVSEEDMEERLLIAEQAKANAEYIKTILGGI